MNPHPLPRQGLLAQSEPRDLESLVLLSPCMLQLHVLGVGPRGHTQGSSEDKGETGVSAPQPFWPQPPDPPLPVAHPCRSVLSFVAHCVRPIVTAGKNCHGSLSSQNPCRQVPQCRLVRGKSHGDSGAGGLGDRDVSGCRETHWGLKKVLKKSACTKPYKVSRLFSSPKIVVETREIQNLKDGYIKEY